MLATGNVMHVGHSHRGLLALTCHAGNIRRQVLVRIHLHNIGHLFIATILVRATQCPDVVSCGPVGKLASSLL